MFLQLLRVHNSWIQFFYCCSWNYIICDAVRAPWPKPLFSKLAPSLNILTSVNKANGNEFICDSGLNSALNSFLGLPILSRIAYTVSRNFTRKTWGSLQDACHEILSLKYTLTILEPLSSSTKHLLFQKTDNEPWTWFSSSIIKICDDLRNLVPLVQFKEPEKHSWRSVTFSKVVGRSLQLY